MLPEAEKIKNAIKKVCDEEIKDVTAPCFRIYKGIITSAPSDGVCGVRLVGDEKTFNLPYAAEAEDLPVGALVWIAVPYSTENSISNGIVWRDVAFKKPGNIAKTYHGTATSENGVMTLPIDTIKHTITQITLANADFNAGALGKTDLLIYAGDYFYTLGSITYIGMEKGTTTRINIASTSSDVWYNNDNIKITVNYV